MLASIRCIAKVAAKEEDHRCPTRAKNFVQIPQGPTLTHSHFLHDTRSLSACVRVCVCAWVCEEWERMSAKKSVSFKPFFCVGGFSTDLHTFSFSLSLTHKVYLYLHLSFLLNTFYGCSSQFLLSFVYLFWLTSKAFPSWTTTMTILTETFIHVNEPE